MNVEQVRVEASQEVTETVDSRIAVDCIDSH